VSTLAVALIPWYIANRDVVERSRAMLRIWAGGVRGQRGRYAQVLARFGAEVRTYTTKVGGERYKRYLIIVKGKVYEDAVNTLLNKRKLKKLAKKHFDVLVEAFRYYSPRGLTGYEVRDKLKKLLGLRLTKRLLSTLKNILRSRVLYRHDWTRTWLRELFRRRRGYGFFKKFFEEIRNCVEKFIEDGCDVDKQTLKKVCIMKIRRDSGWVWELPSKCIYRW